MPPKSSKRSTTATATTRRAKKPSADKQEPVITHRTEGKPSDQGVRPKIERSISAARRTAVSRRFWLGVAAVIGTLLALSVVWWQWDQSHVAKVRGQYIMTATLDEQNRATNGSRVIQQLIQQQLIAQEAQSQDITIHPAAVDDEVQRFRESAGGEAEYQATLTQFGISEALLKNQIRVRLMLEALLADKIQVSDEEIEDYYDDNQEQIDPDESGLDDELRGQISDQLKQQKLSNESELYVSELENNADIDSHLGNASRGYIKFVQEVIFSIPANLWSMVTGS